MNESPAIIQQPDPEVTDESEPIYFELLEDIDREEIRADIERRVEFGFNKYDTVLQTHNGRSHLIDLYQELIDSLFYLKGRLMEKENLDLKQLYYRLITDIGYIKELLEEEGG